MKRVAAVLMLALLLGCTSSTEFGNCIGAFDDKNPKLVYKISKWNAFLAVFFFATAIVPIWVIVDETLCPVGRRETE